jgi:hypothetical protein
MEPLLPAMEWAPSPTKFPDPVRGQSCMRASPEQVSAAMRICRTHHNVTVVLSAYDLSSSSSVVPRLPTMNMLAETENSKKFYSTYFTYMIPIFTFYIGEHKFL